MMPGSVRDVVAQTSFQMGFVIGVVFAVMAGVVAWALRQRPLPLGGLVVASGFVLGIVSSRELPASLPWGLLLLSIGGFVAGRIAQQRAVQPVAVVACALPGALALSTDTGSPQTRWIPTLVVVAVAIGSPLVADFDRRYGARGWSLVCYAISVGGVYLTVPDTELALVLLGACLPALLLGWPTTFASLGWAGSYAAVGALAWVGTFEARGRHAAIFGAVGCLGLLVAEPIADVLRDGHGTIVNRLAKHRSSIVPVAAAQLALVLVASRVAGRTHNVRAAFIMTAVELAAAVAALAILDRPTRTHAPRGDDVT